MQATAVVGARSRTLDVSVIVPTRNESGNIGPLVARLDAALGEMNAEILFVDDSDDDTPACVEAVASTSPRTVRLIHRPQGERAGGLGSAVLAGLRACGGEWAVVMDGDLQHPPEVVPELVAAGRQAGTDVVVASRHIGDGSAAGLGSLVRSAVSGSATWLTKAVFPLRLRGYTDPMSGFFAIRPGQLDLDRLRPSGFKILLEILARSARLRGCEHPFTFASRHSGDSKASWREGLLFLRRLAGLRFASVVGPRLATLVAFLGVGLSGIVVNSAALWLLVALLHSPVLLGAAIATQVSTAWNFVLTDRLVFRGPKARSPLTRFLGFAVVNNVVLVARLPLLAVLVHHSPIGYLAANALTLAAAFAVRFIVSDLVLFTGREQMTTTAEPPTTYAVPAAEQAEGNAEPTRLGPVDLVVDLRDGGEPEIRRRNATTTWHYDIHGLVSIDSVVRLRELDFFATPPTGSAVDIEIRAGRTSTSRIRSRSRVTQFATAPAVSYEEQLGRFGCDFYVDMTEHIKVTVGPLLVRSPHVLYTNVVEALLRFVLVSRGYMLLHSACLDLDGHGVLLSALTDTGKTGTVLRLLRENPSRFLSDDMTIIDRTGTARCYPKPLTISQHTLRAVQAGDLSPREWRRLRVQSRIHSKEGRGVGVRLGTMNLPIMSLNAVTQVVVPPPKYTVQRLVPCDHGASVQVEDLFVIERGPFGIGEIDRDGLVDELIANTDDAYGFPPFRYFAPALVIDGDSYEELRAKERGILEQAISGVRARRLATPDFTWADHIPRLAADGWVSADLGVRRAARDAMRDAPG